jgi:hypothetical protein
MFEQPLAYRDVIKICQNLPAVAYRAKSHGKLHCDSRDMATVATVNKVEAKSWQNLPNLDNQLLYLWMWYSTDCRFKTADL